MNHERPNVNLLEKLSKYRIAKNSVYVNREIKKMLYIQIKNLLFTFHYEMQLLGLKLGWSVIFNLFYEIEGVRENSRENLKRQSPKTRISCVLMNFQVLGYKFNLLF